jgi:hypothetical protein
VCVVLCFLYEVKLKALAGGDNALACTIVVPLSGPIPWHGHEGGGEAGALGGAEMRDLMAQAMASQLSPWQESPKGAAWSEAWRQEPPAALELPLQLPEAGGEQGPLVGEAEEELQEPQEAEEAGEAQEAKEAAAGEPVEEAVEEPVEEAVEEAESSASSKKKKKKKKK